MRKLLLILCLLALPLFADPIKASIHVDGQALYQEQPNWVAVRLQMDKGWHAYWKNPGEVGYPLSIHWDLPEGIQISDIQWPYPEKEDNNHLYKEDVSLLVKVTPDKSFKGDIVPLKGTVEWLICSDENCVPGESEIAIEVPLKKGVPASPEPLIAQAIEHLPQKGTHIEVADTPTHFQITVPGEYNATSTAYFCSEEQGCVKGEVEVINDAEGKLQVRLKKEGQKSAYGTLVIDHQGKKSAWNITPLNEIAMSDEVITHEAHFSGGILWALIFAFAGGLLLNLMPCVLPVISIKVFSFIKMAGESRLKIFQHGLAFSMGVLISFWILAGLLLALQAYGHAVGWGFQLQEPIFVALLAAVILVFGLSLFGVFELGMGMASVAGKAETSKYKNEILASFMSGILATTVATPCTGPFLGSAVGFAVTLPPLSSMLIFTFLGLGMASPYLLVALYPPMLKVFPKPGNWMITFKEVMGFLMILTTMWLLWVFAAQTSSIALFILMFGLFLLSIGSWVFGKWGSPAKKKNIRYVGYFFTFLFLLSGTYTIVTSASLDSSSEAEHLAMADGEWEYFSQERVDELRSEGTPVLVDFTAKWCLICQANHAVLSTGEVEDRIHKLGVVKMKADWTKRDPKITEALRRYGRSSVPLYLLFTSDGDPYVLPQVLTPDLVIEYLEKVEKK